MLYRAIGHDREIVCSSSCHHRPHVRSNALELLHSESRIRVRKKLVERFQHSGMSHVTLLLRFMHVQRQEFA